MKLYETRFKEKSPKILYHGTLSKNVPSVQGKGLLIHPSSNFKNIHGFNTGGQISLATTYNDAFYYISLFANNQPVTILVIKLDSSFKLEKGLSDIEKVVKKDIEPKYIIGAYKGEDLIKLNNLNNNTNYINFNLLKGSDKTVALKYFNK